jgi:hypothetical protein
MNFQIESSASSEEHRNFLLMEAGLPASTHWVLGTSPGCCLAAEELCDDHAFD